MFLPLEVWFINFNLYYLPKLQMQNWHTTAHSFVSLFCFPHHHHSSPTSPSFSKQALLRQKPCKAIQLIRTQIGSNQAMGQRQKFRSVSKLGDYWLGINYLYSKTIQECVKLYWPWWKTAHRLYPIVMVRSERMLESETWNQWGFHQQYSQVPPEQILQPHCFCRELLKS